MRIIQISENKYRIITYRFYIRNSGVLTSKASEQRYIFIIYKRHKLYFFPKKRECIYFIRMKYIFVEEKSINKCYIQAKKG